MTWTRDKTMNYLNAYPLPETFRWPHRDGGERPVKPVHAMVDGYGKWLRETPYFPGLFELIHDLIESLPGADLGDGEWLAERLRALRETAVLTSEPRDTPLAHRLRPLVWTRNQTTLF